MQGDIVRLPRGNQRLGWVCCITPENNEGHVYWQPFGESSAADSREPLPSLQCVDRALIPGDIVRYCDAVNGRDAMGMVVGTEVLLDLQEAGGQRIRREVPAALLRHFVPIRLVTWVVHRSDVWLGRVQSWDEDLVLRFGQNSSEAVSCRCRVRAANQKPGVAISENFYRDFFPGLTVSVALADLQTGALECEWLQGDLNHLATTSPTSDGVQQRVDAIIEEVSVGVARVEWLAQVPLWLGWCSERPPRSDGCQEDKLLFLLGEAESSLRWALGDRVKVDDVLTEVCCVQTFVDVRWQDAKISQRVPSRELQLCNPDAFSFFPSELVCQRGVEDAPSGAASLRGPVPTPLTSRSETRGETRSPDVLERRREEPLHVGYVVRSDPVSRMMVVRWLDENGPSQEEEWSAFDLQIDPEFGYRLSDAVIRCRDWEDPAQEGSGGPQVGQVVALESGLVRVRWLDGAVSVHGPRELYRVGDEDEGSVAESQESAKADVEFADAVLCTDTLPPQSDVSAPEVEMVTDAGDACESPGCNDVSGDCSAMDTAPDPPEPSSAMEVDVAELSFEDIVWETVPSDHHFSHCSPGPGTFARRVQREWTILRRGLPTNVWVHVYPDRMDLLRACLVGPEGTPYADALFFFDVHLPAAYPQIPPQVRFWSFGENLNPNLYENGKVCLSLLGTWSGKDSETWSPERSNLLQVLVSIQGLVLNTEPYYNEPGFERERDTPQGGLRSQRYNESVALSNYHLMLRVLRTPPADFEVAVKKHFAERRVRILGRARGMHDESQTCSEGFKKSLDALLPRLEEVLPHA